MIAIGLLLLTDNGALNARLTDPKFAHPRTYLVQVERIPIMKRLYPAGNWQLGVLIKGKKTRPAQVELLTEVPDLPAREPPVRYRKSVPTAFLKLILTEGRNRQVRRMTAAVGHPTLRLIRINIGSISLEGLEVGEWEYIKSIEF